MLFVVLAATTRRLYWLAWSVFYLGMFLIVLDEYVAHSPVTLFIVPFLGGIFQARFIFCRRLLAVADRDRVGTVVGSNWPIPGPE